MPEGRYGEGPGKIPYMWVEEAIGDLPPIHAGEEWGKDIIHPYGLNKKEGMVICPKCLRYNREDRDNCIHCGHPLDNPITGGVVHLPGITMIDTKKDIDNNMMRKYNFIK